MNEHVMMSLRHSPHKSIQVQVKVL